MIGTTNRYVLLASLYAMPPIKQRRYCQSSVCHEERTKESWEIRFYHPQAQETKGLLVKNSVFYCSLCANSFLRVFMGHEEYRISFLEELVASHALETLIVMSDSLTEQMIMRTAPASIREEGFLAFYNHAEDEEYPAFRSPIEQEFWLAWYNVNTVKPSFDLLSQYPIGPYKVDFAHIPTMTVVELDGFMAHSNTDDIARDRKRQREIEKLGWHVIRFGGKEIRQDAHACATEVLDTLLTRIGQW